MSLDNQKIIIVNCETGNTVDWLACLPTKTAKEVDLASLNAVMCSLYNIGYSFPIVVRQDGDKTYVVDGHLRLLALRKLVKDHFRVVKMLPAVFVKTDKQGYIPKSKRIDERCVFLKEFRNE